VVRHIILMTLGRTIERKPDIALCASR